MLQQGCTGNLESEPKKVRNECCRYTGLCGFLIDILYEFSRQAQIAPEIFAQKGYGVECDLWSLGKRTRKLSIVSF